MKRLFCAILITLLFLVPGNSIGEYGELIRTAIGFVLCPDEADLFFCDVGPDIKPGCYAFYFDGSSERLEITQSGPDHHFLQRTYTEAMEEPLSLRLEEGQKITLKGDYVLELVSLTQEDYQRITPADPMLADVKGVDLYKALDDAAVHIRELDGISNARCRYNSISDIGFFVIYLNLSCKMTDEEILSCCQKVLNILNSACQSQNSDILSQTDTFLGGLYQNMGVSINITFHKSTNQGIDRQLYWEPGSQMPIDTTNSY